MFTGSKCALIRDCREYISCAGNNYADIMSARNTSAWNCGAWIRSAGNKHIHAQSISGWENVRVFLKHECEDMCLVHEPVVQDGM